MSKNNVLVLGYGIDADRTEAVSINTLKLIEQLKLLGNKVWLINVGYKNSYIDTEHNMIWAILNRQRILRRLKKFIKLKKINIIHDVFVLPLATELFTLHLLDDSVNVRVIKEIHNDSGHSTKWHIETFIRMFANRQKTLNKILQKCRCYTRNIHLAKKYQLQYIPQPIIISPLKRSVSSRARLSYLGHPLKKKGVYEFPSLIKQIAKTAKNAVWSFALSDVGMDSELKKQLTMAANQAHVSVSFQTRVIPHSFFSNQDYYLLPIQDQYGAISTPNTVLEAMEAGAVVIVTDIPSLEGIVTPNETGIVVSSPTAQAFCKAWKKINSDIALQRAIRLNARKFIKTHFSQKVIMDKLRVLYAT